MDRKWIEGKSLDELLGMLVGTAQVGSPVHTQNRAAIDVEIARMQREAGDKAAKDRAEVGEGVCRRGCGQRGCRSRGAPRGALTTVLEAGELDGPSPDGEAVRGSRCDRRRADIGAVL